MDPTPTPRAEGPASRSAWCQAVWSLLLLGLFAWQGWMTLGLFGEDAPWERLLDEQPVLSGRHPLHLYHGYLGAQSLRHTGSSCCYDPANYAGYPKTPVFDSGSRPAELFLAVTGAAYRPAAYKVGLAGSCLLVPWLLMIACRGTGLGLAGTFLATGAGLLVWWGGPGRRALEAGDLDLYVAAMALLAHAGLLLRFDRAPGVLAWLGLLFTGCVGWFAHPLLFLALAPLFLVYYLTVGTRHRYLSWHLALLATQVGALALNAFWLTDWVAYWWIRSPLPHSTVTLAHRTLHTVWDAPVWGEPADRAVAVLLLASGLVGILWFHHQRRRAAARVLGLGTAGLWLLAVLGISWEPLGRVGTHGLMAPALWFAAVPAAYAWTRTFHGLACLTGSAWRAAGLVGLALLGTGVALREPLLVVANRCTGTAPLLIGLGPEQEAVVETLRTYTGPEARILWEDWPTGRDASRWTALLPLLTGRVFIGGLDPDAGIAHMEAGLTEHALAGRPIASWTDAALEDYCRRYNVGWIVCWSPATIARLDAWAKAELKARLGHGGSLFAVTGQEHSYVLKGQAELVHADFHHITLADVVPDKHGIVEISLHYQSGMRASPSRVHLEPATDPKAEERNDPIPFIRLRVSSPVARVTLTWEER
jgi:hypothetical protein